MKIPRPADGKPVPQGVYAATITPRRERGVEVDLGAMLEVIDFVTSGGVDGVALFGSTGEFLHFAPEERSRFVALAAKRCRVPVLANVSHSTFDGAVAMAEEAAGSGVAGVMAMPPYFFRYEADSVRAFFLEFAAQVSKWTPVYLYNIPLFTNSIPIQVAEELLRSGAFAGIKDSGGDWDYLSTLIGISKTAPVRVLCGNDPLMARARQAGAAGCVSGIASAAPELICALDRAVVANDAPKVAKLEARVNELARWLACFPIPVGVREAAAARGIKTGSPAVPLSPECKLKLDQFRIWFRAWLHEVENECR